MEAKFKRIVVAVVLLAVVVGGVFLYREMSQDKGAKEITIVIKDSKGKVLYDEKVNTDAGTLGDLLKEMKKDGEIKLSYDTDPAMGLFITGLGSDKLIENTNDKFWMYDSKNNKSCVEAEFCDAADNLNIANKDKFTFTYTQF